MSFVLEFCMSFVFAKGRGHLIIQIIQLPLFLWYKTIYCTIAIINLNLGLYISLIYSIGPTLVSLPLSSFLTVHVLSLPSGVCPTPVTRKEWGARPPKAVRYLKEHVTYAFVHHTYQPSACYTKKDCIKKMRIIQNFHMDVRGEFFIHRFTYEGLMQMLRDLHVCIISYEFNCFNISGGQIP